MGSAEIQVHKHQTNTSPSLFQQHHRQASWLHLQLSGLWAPPALAVHPTIGAGVRSWSQRGEEDPRDPSCFKLTSCGLAVREPWVKSLIYPWSKYYKKIAVLAFLLNPSQALNRNLKSKIQRWDAIAHLCLFNLWFLNWTKTSRHSDT